MDFKWIKEYLSRAAEKTMACDLEELAKFHAVVSKVRDKDGTIYFAGNGASTTIASHAALDIGNQLGMKCVAMNDPNVITCFSNDFGYENWVMRFVQLNCREGDAVVLVSSSGNSQNMVNAAKQAKEQGVDVVSFTGFSDSNPLRAESDVALWVDSDEYNLVETIHMTWIVSVCDHFIHDEIENMGVHGRLLGTPNEEKK